jgi:cytochrome P450
MIEQQAAPSPVAIPSLPGYPLVGIIPNMLNNPHAIFDQAFKTGDLVRVPLGPLAAYIVVHPDLFSYFLKDNHHNYNKASGIWRMMGQVLGNGLPVSEGEFWLRQRRLMQPAFHRQHMAGFIELMGKETQDTADLWRRSVANGETLDLMKEMSGLTLRIVARSMFGQGLSLEDCTRFGDAFSDALKYLEYRAWLYFIPKDAPMPGKGRYQRAYDITNEIILRMINQKRAEGATDGDLLSMLIDARDADDGTGMTDEQLRDETLTMFLAGHETGAVSMMWLFQLLANHPEVEAKLHEEVDRVLGGRVPTLEDLAGLPYTRAVVDETMRLYPAAWLITRNVVETEMLPNGMTVPKGAMLLFSFYHLHRNTEFFDEPEVFQPERFLSGTSAHMRRAYMPFGTGPRMCIGASFSQFEAVVILATLAQQFKVRVHTPRPVQPKPRVSLHADQDLPMEIILR